MELMAPIKALKKIPVGEKVQIYTDSKYVKMGITEWIESWKKNNWKTSSKKKVKIKIFGKNWIICPESIKSNGCGLKGTLVTLQMRK